MAGYIVAINRHVVKGLTQEPLPHVLLRAGHGLPNDRRYAFALAETAFDERNPVPLPKTKFLTLARFERLAALTSRFDDATETLVLRHKGQRVAGGKLDNPTDRTAIEHALAAFMGDEIGGRPRLVTAPGHRFTDVSVRSAAMMEAVSVVNLASIRDLEAKIGRKVDPVRFRANFLVEGLDPWVERDWIHREISIGGVICKGALCIRRCPATEVNPTTAERDIALPAELKRHFGHIEMGVYLYIQSDGNVAHGSVVAS
ncbi:MAG TPA: MOSC domain-containing protein [Stellaceae bacterium]|nr:MOSC domain-containing protein [Stellaceae bacterium]